MSAALLTTFYRGENPLKADKLNQAINERVAKTGDTMTGNLRLALHPEHDLDAASKFYVDAVATGTIFTNTISVTAFGAMGDGVTDDTDAVQAALVAGAGGTVLVPTGRYVLSESCQIPSNTRILGQGPGSVFVTAAPAWVGAAVMMRNVNWGVTVNTDENIVIESVAFDWTGYGGVMGAAHCIQLRLTTGVKIINCFFQRGGDAIACLHCYDVGIENCTAYNANNCLYDFWYGCQNVRVHNCYGESAAIVQMVNFNSTPAGIVPDAQVGSGFSFVGNTLKCTAATARAIFLTPLGGNVNTVRDVVIADNILDGVIVNGGGDIQCVIVKGNTFRNTGANSAVGLFNDAFDTPTGFVCIGNTFADAATVGANLGVIRYSGDNYIIADNNFLGNAYYAAIDVATNVGIVNGNRGLPGTSTVFAVGSRWITSQSGVRIANNERMAWYTVDGDRVQMLCQTDDNWRFVGTNAAGAEREIFNFQNKNDTSALRISPDLDISLSHDLQFSFRGANAGVANALAANLQVNGTDTDIAMRILAKGNKGILVDTFDGVPSTTMVPNGMFAVVNNSGTVSLVYNLAGVLKTVALT